MQSCSSQSFLRDSIKFFFSSGGKKTIHHDRSIDRRIVALRFAELPQFLNSLNWENLSFHHTRQCIESVAPRQFFAPPWAAPLVNWTTRFLRLRSCLVRSFHLDSFRVRFSIRVLPSIPHFIIDFFVIHTSSSFSESISTSKHFKGASTSSQWFGNFFPWVLRPSLAGHKLELFMVVALVLFTDVESRGDSICQFVCFLFEAVELPFHNFFVFLARYSSFDLRHRPLNPLGSASPPQVAQRFQ